MANFVESTTGVLYTSNGFDPPLRWDGLTTQMEQAGLVAPTSVPTVSATGTGGIVGDYYAYVRFVDRLGYVSNLSPISLKYTAPGATGSITAASNASPIVVTSASHGLSTGAVVKITGVGGNTSANNTWTITKVDGDTFSLNNSHGTADYNGGGTWISGVLTITYANIQAPTDPKVVRRQILRNTDGQAATFYVDVDTTDLSSSTFTSTQTDTFLAAGTAQAILDSSGLPLANLHNPPPNWKAVWCNHLDRMFAAVQYDEARGAVKVTNGSLTVSGVGTDWVAGLATRYLYVAGATSSYQILSVNVALQQLTLTSPYLDVTDSFGVYAIRPAPAERRLVYWTPAGLPESWPATYALSVQEDDDDITGLMQRGSFLYILERRHIYKLTFQEDPAQDGAIFLSANRGCINQRCWQLVDNDAYMLDEYGVHKFDATAQIEPISTPIQEMFRPNSLYKFHINWKASERFFSVLYRPQEVIRWFVALAGSYIPKHALTYNYRLQRWWLEEWRIGVGGALAGRIGLVPYAFLGTEARKVCALWEGTTDLADPTKGTLRGTVTSAGIISLTDTTANFPSTALNAPLVIVDGTGKGQVRKIVAQTATVLTVDQPWATSLDTTSIYQVGGVVWNYKGSWFRYSNSEEMADRRIEVMFSPTAGACTIDMRTRTDFSGTPDKQQIAMSFKGGAGVRSLAGQQDMVIDTTKQTGIVQKLIPGHREMMSDGPRFSQLELAGATNTDLVAVFQITLDGLGNSATVGQQ